MEVKTAKFSLTKSKHNEIEKKNNDSDVFNFFITKVSYSLQEFINFIYNFFN
jgi:hypothetical protein